MNFKGQLLIPNESGRGLRVDLDVAAHHLAVESESGGLGAWPLEVVDVRRLQGDVFAMTVAGEDLHFVADDALSFAYSGIPAITRVSMVKPRSGLRSWLSKVWGETRQRPPDPMPPSVIEEPVPTVDLAPTTESSPEITGIELFDWEDQDWAQDQDVDTADGLPTLQDISVEETGTDPFAVEVQAPDEEPMRDEQPAGCPGLRGDGLACQSPILTSSGYCIAHDPNRTVVQGYQAAHEARARLRARSVGRLNRVYGRLDKAMRQVERGELDPEVAMAMAQLARTMCAILDLDEEPDDSPDGS